MVWTAHLSVCTTEFLDVQRYPARCQEGAVEKLPPAATIKHENYHDGQALCSGIHKPRYCMKLNLPFTSSTHTNYACIGNEIKSLASRHLQTNTKTTCIDPEVAFQRLRQAYPPIDLKPWTYEMVIQHKPPSQRKRYRRAYQQLMETGLQEKDFRIASFIKMERMNYPDDDPTSTTLKPPRMIQARSSKFNLYMQRFIMPYANKWKRLRQLEGRTPFAKGMNALQIAQQLHQDWTHFSNPIALLLDHKAYDSKLDVGWLKATHSYYRDHYVNHDLPLECQLSNKCYTGNGVKYNVEGTRMSGDPDTSDGNSTANLALICDLMREVESRDTVMGDDSVIIFESEHYELIKSRIDCMSQRYPWETEYRFTQQFEDVDFCQCKPVLTINGWVMVRNPLRAITRGTTCIAPLITTKLHHLLPRYFRAVGDCEYSCNPGVPVLQDFALWMMRFHDRGMKLPFDRTDWKTIPGRLLHHITDESRLSFFKSFGVDIPTQLALENWFKTTPARIGNIYNMQHPVNGASKHILQPCYEDAQIPLHKRPLYDIMPVAKPTHLDHELESEYPMGPVAGASSSITGETQLWLLARTALAGSV